MQQTMGPSPGSRKYAGHRIRITPIAGKVTASIGQRRIADSASAVNLAETGYENVVYFPPGDVSTELLIGSDSKSICPFKGEARYLASTIGGTVVDVAWRYQDVYDDVAPIAGFIAFYADKVDLKFEPLNDATTA